MMTRAALLAAFLLAGCGDAHWNHLPAMTNEAIMAKEKQCADAHLAAGWFENSRGEIVKVQCYWKVER